ncbi:MAG TPA: hypothetical protein VED59_08070, partial [Acidimicrobiales bacterium]|nr:hypothetical protein [Acidimicrobiales bacterium]
MGKTAVLRAIGAEAASRLGWAVVLHRCQFKERVLNYLADEALRDIHRAWPGDAAQLTRQVLGFSHPAVRGAAARLEA